MILSNQQIFSDQQAVTATALSENIIDLKAAGVPYGAVGLESDLGKGEPVGLLVQCTEQATAAGSATVTMTLEVSDNENMSSSDVIHTSGAIPKADLVAGWKLPLNKIPVGAAKRYMAVRYTVATGPLTAGKFTSALTNGHSESWS